MKDRLTVKQAAAILEMSIAKLRLIIDEDDKRFDQGLPKKYDIGDSDKGGNSRHEYYIYLGKVLKRMGYDSVDDLPPEKRRLLE